MTIVDSETPGPTAMIGAPVHGNEICRAFPLVRLLSKSFKVSGEQLLLLLVNNVTFLCFDSSRSYTTRFVDKDTNRLWSFDILDSRRQSAELARARELRPFAKSANFLLDLHSTFLPAPPMLLCGTQEKGRSFSKKIDHHAHVVADARHMAGVRLVHFGPFGDPASANVPMLAEREKYFDCESSAVALNTTLAFLHAADVLDKALKGFPGLLTPDAQNLIEVTRISAIRSDHFPFDRDFQCFEMIAETGKLIARDGSRNILLPYDDCLLVRPVRWSERGQTAIRLARYVSEMGK